MVCIHLNSLELKLPTPSQSVYREDCTQCFDSIDDSAGLDVCLYCFNGGCGGHNNHNQLHFHSTRHPLVVNVKRTRKRKHHDEPPVETSKLAIVAETEADRYDTATLVSCFECGETNLIGDKIDAVVDGVLKANTFAKQAEVKAWELEITPCEHTLCLQQESARPLQQDLGHCSACELKQNLWLCLQCGNLGCGRNQTAGAKGNSHGLAHADATSHPLAVKLGSITPEGTADVYCYACDEERVDPDLAGHLSYWGIKIAEQEKTEKSLVELQVEQNMKWDFSMTTEDGKELTPLFGKGLTGLKNLGNSCYLSSILQCLFSLPAFQERYLLPQLNTPLPAEDLETQFRKLADGLLSGTYSRPNPEIEVSESSGIPHQKGLAPAMLKHLIGRGHEEFSTMRQQDAFELLLHLFKLITRSNHMAPLEDPVRSFRFAMEQRLQCISCKKVRYSTDEQDNISIPVPVRRKAKDAAAEAGTDAFEAISLWECLDIFTGKELVELTCPSCGSKDGFTKESKFKTFPTNLAVNARRFDLVNWVPTKLDVPVVVDDEPFNLDRYMSQGQQADEITLPDDALASSTPSFTPHGVALAQLEGMGFNRARSEKALYHTGNTDADSAMTWLFAHMDDADIDTPLNLRPSAVGSSASASVDPASLAMLQSMGIPEAQARKALKETTGDINRAVDWVFSHPDDAGDLDVNEADLAPVASAEEKKTRSPGSTELPARYQLASIVCHKGGSIHAGHYVAFVRKVVAAEGAKEPGDRSERTVGKRGAGMAYVGKMEGEGEGKEETWVLFNDEKVVRAAEAEEMKKFAYVYFFRRV